MNNLYNEQQEILSTPEKEKPELTFESYIPDDFLYAPEPDMWFRYSITDPVTGGPLLDSTTNLYATDFIAYSVEYEGEYYWTYNVYREEVPGLEPEEDSLYMIDTYTPANSKILFPQSFEGAWNVNVESFERDLHDGDLSVTMSVQTEYPHLVIDSFDFDTGEYTVSEAPPYDLYLNETIYVFANNELVFEFYSYKEYLFYEILFPFEIKYDESRKGKHEFTFDVDYSLFEDEDLELRFESYKTPEYSHPDIDDEYVLVDSINQTERFVIPTNQETDFNISFEGTSLNKTVSIPYSWESGENNKWENFTFNKLFSNSYKYPTTTKDLIEVSYDSGDTSVFPENQLTSEATIKLDDGREFNLPIKKRYDGDKVVFYIDENMYYDYEQEKVFIGTSDGKFENEKGIVMPWDEVISGEIIFTFKVQSYKDYTFNFILEISDTNKLRGDNAKYEIEEI